MAATTHSSDHSSAGHHITPVSTYLKVYGALVVLTIITVSLTKVNFGPFNTLVAMIVASVKASLVILWFMHQKYETKLNRITFSIGFLGLILLAFFSCIDIFTRVNMIQLRDFSIPKSQLQQTQSAPKAEEGAKKVEPAPEKK